MIATSLVVVSAMVFMVVFAVLAALAAAMRLMTLLFPFRTSGVDAALAAAVSSTVTTLVPGARVTRIEEDR